MEDILTLYTRLDDPSVPLVCMDETSKHLTKECRAPIPAKAGQQLKYDYEYERNGVAHIFMFYEPFAGRRHLSVTTCRTRIEWAHQIKQLVDIHYAQASKIILVMDNLNTHSGASLYEAFSPAKARRILERLEIHYTPKHRSWLNMAEIELAILTRQCLIRRIPDRPTLFTEVSAWEEHRNTAKTPVNGRFTTENARVRLKHLYSTVSV